MDEASNLGHYIMMNFVIYTVHLGYWNLQGCDGLGIWL